MAEQSSELVILGAPFHVDEHALTVATAAPPTLEDVAVAADRLKRIHGALMYWIGDVTRLAEGLFHEEAAQIIDKDFLDEKTINDCRFVATRVDRDVRRMAPSWDHAKAVANLKPADQKRFIQRALDEDWIASKLKTEVAAVAAGGKSGMRFLLIVDAGTEAKQGKLADTLERDGYQVTKRTGVKRDKTKGKKAAKKGKAGPITARSKKGGARPYSQKPRRVR